MTKKHEVTRSRVDHKHARVGHLYTRTFREMVQAGFSHVDASDEAHRVADGHLRYQKEVRRV